MARNLIASDNFNRSTGLGSDWAQTNPNWGDVTIISNIKAGTSGANNNQDCPMARWVGAGTFSNDQYAKGTILDMGPFGTAYWVGVIVRASADLDAARDCYFVAVQDSVTSNQPTRIGKIVNGTYTQLSSTTTLTWVNGDTIALEVEGTSLRAYRNDVQITALNATDSDPALTTGKPGLMVPNSVNIDSWEGGDVTAASTRLQMALLGVG